MKSVVLAFSLSLFGQMSLAESCPKIEGYFDISSKLNSPHVTGIKQSGCKLIRISDTTIIQNRVVENRPVLTLVPENEMGRCPSTEYCNVFFSTDNYFEIKDSGSIKDVNHGVCSYSGRKWQLSAGNNLIQVLLNARCTDGTNGEVKQEYYRRTPN